MTHRGLQISLLHSISTSAYISSAPVPYSGLSDSFLTSASVTIIESKVLVSGVGRLGNLSKPSTVKLM